MQDIINDINKFNQTLNNSTFTKEMIRRKLELHLFEDILITEDDSFFVYEGHNVRAKKNNYYFEFNVGYDELLGAEDYNTNEVTQTKQDLLKNLKSDNIINTFYYHLYKISNEHDEIPVNCYISDKDDFNEKMEPFINGVLTTKETLDKKFVKELYLFSLIRDDMGHFPNYFEDIDYSKNHHNFEISIGDYLKISKSVSNSITISLLTKFKQNIYMNLNQNIYEIKEQWNYIKQYLFNFIEEKYIVNNIDFYPIFVELKELSSYLKLDFNSNKMIDSFMNNCPIIDIRELVIGNESSKRMKVAIQYDKSNELCLITIDYLYNKYFYPCHPINLKSFFQDLLINIGS